MTPYDLMPAELRGTSLLLALGSGVLGAAAAVAYGVYDLYRAKKKGETNDGR